MPADATPFQPTAAESPDERTTTNDKEKT